MFFTTQRRHIGVIQLTACRFGGLIAAGVLTDLNGVHGLAGWRWLFIIEGSATVGIALIAMYYFP